MSSQEDGLHTLYPMLVSTTPLHFVSPGSPDATCAAAPFPHEQRARKQRTPGRTEMLKELDPWLKTFVFVAPEYTCMRIVIPVEGGSVQRARGANFDLAAAGKTAGPDRDARVGRRACQRLGAIPAGE